MEPHKTQGAWDPLGMEGRIRNLVSQPFLGSALRVPDIHLLAVCSLNGHLNPEQPPHNPAPGRAGPKELTLPGAPVCSATTVRGRVQVGPLDDTPVSRAGGESTHRSLLTPGN